MKLNERKKMKNGISLMVLVITIVVVILLLTAIFIGLSKSNMMDSAKKAKFMSNFTNVEEGVTIYATSKLTEENIDYILPVENKLTLSDKQDIKNNVPTLKAKVEELSGETIDNVDLYRINPTLIGAENLYSFKTKGYLIDANTRQIYDYEGEYFEGMRWHTLDAGVGNVAKGPDYEIWDGWIRLNLYYPSNSTERMWRLSSDGETRTEGDLIWQNYTGPITVPLNRVQDVWIKYKINGTTTVIPPAGEALVDIEPDSTLPNMVNVVNVSIEYDLDATTKEYKIGNSDWRIYTGPFAVTQNVLIEARVVKPDNVYDSNGNLTLARNVQNSDSYYVGNIKEPPKSATLKAPKITRLESRDGIEIAAIHVDYPAAAVKKVYTVDYGTEQIYTDDISVTRNGTYIIAYYYDISGNRSPQSSIYVSDTTIDSPTDGDLPAPNAYTIGARDASEVQAVRVDYPAVAVTKVYTVDYGIEQPYIGDISITKYDTYIIAYYYDASGNRSPIDDVYIDSNGGTGGPPPPTFERPRAPSIGASPTSVVTSVQVSVNPPSGVSVRNTYIRFGSGSYQLYTAPITVYGNVEVSAYYVTTDGIRSKTGYRSIDNIRQSGGSGKTLPYVNVYATPDPYSSIKKYSQVTVGINYADATTVEYSDNGITYTPYTEPFVVTKNCTIYARAINSNGTSTDKLYITNIGTNPTTYSPLAVNITAAPEPAATSTLVTKVSVSIEYDAAATDKYYSIGKNSSLIPYTGPFDVSQNCTVYAYALNENQTGLDSKVIDNLVDGISDPVITGTPTNSFVSSKDTIKIEYDRSATIKQYSIDNGPLRDYTGPFDVSQNCTIYAYSTNAKGQASTANYTVTNIPAPPTILLVDQGDYFILKLNYPVGSTTKEYKWKIDGIWKTYPSDGILLIKPEYKDKVVNVSGEIIVKIKDDTGNYIDFSGDWYILDVGISEIQENIFMRWDRVAPSAPEILLSTTEPTNNVTVTINYEDYLIKKQYKVVDASGNITTDWTDYTSPINVTSNNTTIYARGQDDAEVWSSEARKKITNIDEVQPEIKLIADLQTAQTAVAIRVSVTDDIAVGLVKWAEGIQADSYFTNGGTTIDNNSIVKVTSNGYYTFYAIDKAGNTQIYTLNITNVDLVPPKISIAIDPETTVTLTATATINYGDSVTKQYKVGASTVSWTNYTAPINLSSYTIISSNLKNADGTVTVYAKGTDSAGNVTTVSKNVVSLDLDMPTAPVITSSSGYPILTSYGIKYDAQTTITYDSRTDIDNYYSLDGGTTWNKYIDPFQCKSGTIIAKSVKKSSGLEKTASKTVSMPSDSLGTAAYDGSDSTYYGITGAYSRRILVDASMYLKKVRVYLTSTTSASDTKTLYISFYNATGTVLASYSVTVQMSWSSYSNVFTVPDGTRSLYISTGSGTTTIRTYEIGTYNSPSFTATNGYITLNADTTKNITSPYQMVTISYFSTSVQRLYSLDGGTTWLDYKDQAIKVNQGSTIYAKGIDQYGNPTYSTISYTANVGDAIGAAAADSNYGTYFQVVGAYSRRINIDSSMSGKKMRVYLTRYTSASSNKDMYIYFYDSSGAVLSSLTITVYMSWSTYNTILTVPNGAAMMTISTGSTTTTIRTYELEVYNAPTFSATNGYITLNADPLKTINTPYQMVTISYFSTSVQRLYSLDNGVTWLNYNDQPVKVDVGKTILAKGIDKYGIESVSGSGYTANVGDAMGTAACDGSYSTYYSVTGAYSRRINLDSSMSLKQLRVYLTSVTSASDTKTLYINFYNSSGAVLSSTPVTVYTSTSTYDHMFTVPAGSTSMTISTGSTTTNIKTYEIQPIP